jgi:hypothetical protein
VNSAYANTALSPRAVTSFNNFALTFKSVTSTAPSNVTLTVSDGSGDSTQPITADVALRFTAPSAGTVANISMAFKFIFEKANHFLPSDAVVKEYLTTEFSCSSSSLKILFMKESSVQQEKEKSLVKMKLL